MGNMRIIEIPASMRESAGRKNTVRKLRVAAYARVSSSSEDQLNSFAAQNAHYTEIITANPEWEFVDVYADKGITGTSGEIQYLLRPVWIPTCGRKTGADP